MPSKIVHVVEDDVASAASIQALMMSVGRRVAVYHSAREFLDAFEKSTCGCVVVDIRLAGMNGLELQRELLSRGDAPPIIMITGHADAALHDEAIENGALVVLEKPFDASHLLQWISTATSCTASRESSTK